MNKNTTKYLAPTGLLLTTFSLLGAVLLGFGGFNLLDFFNYSISGFVSRPQMIFLALTAIGFLILSLNWYKQSQKLKNHNVILLLYLAVSIVFFITASFGLISQMKNSDFWVQTTFEEPGSTLFFNNLTLATFLTLGIQQTIFSIIFFKTNKLEKNQISKTIKVLTLISGILFLIKTIIDYPIIKEAILILSFMLKIPIPNNIVSLVAPLVYVYTQIKSTTTLIVN